MAYKKFNAPRKENFVVETQDLQDILMSSCYVIPHYQRTYDWKKDRVNGLLEDIGRVFEDDFLNPSQVSASHHIGNITLLETEEDGETVFDVVDGQQRMTTISLFLGTVWQELNKLDDSNRDVLMLKLQIWGMMFGDSLYAENPKPRILHTLSTEKTTFVSLLHKGKCNSLKANKNMTSAFKQMSQFLRTLYAEIVKEPISPKKNLPLEYLEHITNVATKGFTLGVGKTKDDLVAQRAFSDMNSKSQPLTAFDLIRNSWAHAINKDDFLDVWQEVINTLNDDHKNDFAKIWIEARLGINMTTKDLFKSFVDLVKKGDIKRDLDTLRDFAAQAQRYLNHRNLKNAQGEEIDALYWIQTAGVTQHKTLLLAAETLELEHPNLFKQMCNEMAKVTMLIKAKKLPTNTLEKVMPDWCKKIKTVSTKGEMEVFLDKTLREFRNTYGFGLAHDLDTMQERVVWEKKGSKDSERPKEQKNQTLILAYWAHALEQQTGSQETASAFHKRMTLEHIIPVSTEEDYKGKYEKATFRDHVCRFGNLTLLSGEDNRSAGAKPVKDKLKVYFGSAVALTKASIGAIPTGRKGRVAEMLRILPQIDSHFDLQKAQIRSQVLTQMMAEHITQPCE